MLAAIRSAAILGIDAYDVTVEVDAARGLPAWTIVGLPAGAVKESRERVGAALVNSGFTLPPRRVTVNLAPARWTTAKRSALRPAHHQPPAGGASEGNRQACATCCGVSSSGQVDT